MNTLTISPADSITFHLGEPKDEENNFLLNHFREIIAKFDNADAYHIG